MPWRSRLCVCPVLPGHAPISTSSARPWQLTLRSRGVCSPSISRGRGRSDYDRNPNNYTLPVDLADLLAILTALDIGRPVFIGTSRGGLLTMLLGFVAAAGLAGVVLNDIGPVIEAQGLMRIKGYVGKLPPPRSFEEGAEILRRLFDAQFRKLDGADWLAFARRTWRKQDGRLVPDLRRPACPNPRGHELEHPSTLWNEFDALGPSRCWLSAAPTPTCYRKPPLRRCAGGATQMDILNVPDQGHAPLLAEPPVIGGSPALLPQSRRPRIRFVETAPKATVVFRPMTVYTGLWAHKYYATHSSYCLL